MSEPEQSSSHDLADTASALAGLAEGSLTETVSESSVAPQGHDGSRDDDSADSHGQPSTPPRPSSSGTQRGLPAVQPALASLLPPVAAQLHLGRLSSERSPQLPGSDAELSAAQAEADDDRPTHFPPRSTADAEPWSEGSEPPLRAPIVPPVAEGATAQPPSAVLGEPSTRTGSRPKPVLAPPVFPPFAKTLWSAGLLAELRIESLGALPRLDDPPSPRQRLDFLEAYYAAGTDPVVSLRRRATDRWFVYDASQPLAGPQLVQRLTFVLPELAQAHLERVGGKLGTLLLRAGEHVCALDDDQSERNHPHIAVGEIVRGMNMLMERRGERVRLVGLVGDGTREAYVGLDSLTLALALAGQELLTARDTETLMHLTGW